MSQKNDTIPESYLIIDLDDQKDPSSLDLPIFNEDFSSLNEELNSNLPTFDEHLSFLNKGELIPSSEDEIKPSLNQKDRKRPRRSQEDKDSFSVDEETSFQTFDELLAFFSPSFSSKHIGKRPRHSRSCNDKDVFLMRTSAYSAASSCHFTLYQDSDTDGESIDSDETASEESYSSGDELTKEGYLYDEFISSDDEE